jgi:hypothetical protein
MAQPAQFVALIGAQRSLGAAAAVGSFPAPVLGVDPVAQGLVVDAEFSADLTRVRCGDESTSSTASLRNSSGYFGGRGTRTSFPQTTVWSQGVRSEG